MVRVAAQIEAALAEENRTIFIVYQNPVYGACFDALPALKRYFATKVLYARNERGFGPDITDGVIIWQGGNLIQAHSSANAQITVTRPGHRAEVAT